jgi:H+-translocating NAD(P) transhydrogenase subunit alpha
VDVGGVAVIGPIDVPSSVPHHASLMYAKNVANFVGLLVRDGAVALDTDDELVTGCAVTRDGEVVDERVRAALGAGEGVAS